MSLPQFLIIAVTCVLGVAAVLAVSLPKAAATPIPEPTPEYDPGATQPALPVLWSAHTWARHQQEEATR